ncbi:MAG TPA: hypothetical protein VMU30_12915 [Bacteroidota bacterium]|nr:hypothetical protein [Bacteroidota bacterium]
MKTIAFFYIGLCLLSFTLKAQDSTNNAKLDTLLFYQKKISTQQENIYNEVVRYREPLENKKYGVEFNPAYFLVSCANSYTVFSGGFSFFDVDRHAEIACPIFYQSGTNKGAHPLTLWNQDIDYRKFLGQHQDGFYIEGGVRFTHIKGEAGGDLSLLGLSLFPSSSAPMITTDKLGAKFGIGYRYFSSSGFYWGISLVYGAYFSADERTIQGVTFDDTKTILDIEILKFGYAF